MIVKSKDGRLTVEKMNTTGSIHVHAKGLAAQQVFDALLPLLPPPPPTARDIAEAAAEWAGLRHMGRTGDSFADLARRWDEGGRP